MTIFLYGLIAAWFAVAIPFIFLRLNHRPWADKLKDLRPKL